MAEHDDMDLTIEKLDEQIAALSQTALQKPAASLLDMPDARLIQDLRSIHASANRADKGSLEHVLDRLHKHEEQHLSAEARSPMETQPSPKTPRQDHGVSLMHTITAQQRQFGNYRLLSLLDSGGFADIYLAEHIYLKVQSAVKVLQMHLFDKEEQQRFLNEARILARLQHPHIIQIRDFGVEDTLPFLVMSYASHGNLRNLHPEGSRVSLNHVVRYVKQAAGALQYAHEQQLIHRDLKPENLLLDEHGELLLSDFGIAIIARSSRSQSVQDVVGTATYMAPEQIKGRPRPASDQYALAVLAYEWLYGTPPFEGPDYIEIVKQHLNAPVPDLHEKMPGISPAVAAVITRALGKDYRQRFASIQAFADALEQAHRLDTMPEPAPDVQEKESARNRNLRPEQPHERHRSRRLVLAMLGGAGALAIGGGYLGWQALSAAGTLAHSSNAQSATSVATTTSTIGKTVTIYNGLSNTQIQYFEIDTLAWSPDGTRILSAGSATTVDFPVTGKLTTWDAFTGENILTNDTYSGAGIPGDVHGKGATWSPDGKRIVAMTIEILSRNSVDFVMRMLDAVNGQVVLAPSVGFSALSWSTDGKSLTLLGFYVDPNLTITPSTPVNLYKDRHITIWDASTGHLLVNHDAEFLYALDTPDPQAPNKDPLDIWGPKHRYLASFYNRHINVWDAFNAQLISRYPGDGSNPAKFALAWSHDGQYLASGWGSEVHISTVLTARKVLTYQGHTLTVRAIAWSPDGSQLATGGEDNTVQIWDATDGKLLATYREHADHILALDWSPDGGHIVSGSADGMVRIWTAK